MSDVTRGERLKQLREAAGLYQRQVAAVFDVDKQAVSAWEQDRANPSTDKIGRLDDLYRAGGEVLRLYGVTVLVDYRVGVLESEVTQLRAQVASLDDRVTELHEALATLSEQSEARIAELERLARARGAQ